MGCVASVESVPAGASRILEHPRNGTVEVFTAHFNVGEQLAKLPSVDHKLGFHPLNCDVAVIIPQGCTNVQNRSKPRGIFLVPLAQFPNADATQYVNNLDGGLMISWCFERSTCWPICYDIPKGEPTRLTFVCLTDSTDSVSSDCSDGNMPWSPFDFGSVEVELTCQSEAVQSQLLKRIQTWRARHLTEWKIPAEPFPRKSELSKQGLTNTARSHETDSCGSRRVKR